MSDTERSLLDAVLENPDDDLPRLVYADFLEEHGDATRAEFIRVQIKLSQIVESDDYDSDEYASATKTIMHLESTTYMNWLNSNRLSLGTQKYNVHTSKDEVYICCYDHHPKFHFQRGFVYEVFAHFSWIYSSWHLLNSLPLATIRFKITGRLTNETGIINISKQGNGDFAVLISNRLPLELSEDRRFKARNLAFEYLYSTLERINDNINDRMTPTWL